VIAKLETGTDGHKRQLSDSCVEVTQAVSVNY